MAEENTNSPSGDGREVLRHKQRTAIVVHRLKPLPDGTCELWRVTERPGTPPASAKVGAFPDEAQAMGEAQKIKRRLEGDGWQEVK